MESFKVSVKDADYLEKSLSFIREFLTSKKVSKENIIKTELLSEETIVLLTKHAPEGSSIRIQAKKTFSDVNLVISMKGEQFSFDPGESDISLDIEEDEAEDAIRALFLKAFGEKYKYTHKDNINRVRITAEKSGQSSLYATLIAMALGLILGFLLKTVFPAPVANVVCSYVLEPIKTMFMNALKIVIAPVIFFSLVTCFSQFKNLAELGKLAAKVMAVYMMTTVVAVFIGTSIALLIKPGAFGFALSESVALSEVNINTDIDYSLLHMIVNIVPSNFVKPFVEADTLQIMFLAVLVGIAVGMIGEYTSVLSEIFEACNSLFLTITTMITKLIPLAVFCSVALMLFNMGGSSFLTILHGGIVQIFSILTMICFYGIMVLLAGRLNPIKFFKNAKAGMLASFSLSSSSAAMPTNIKVCIEDLGISPKICNFSIPLGTTVNMDGTCIYLSSFALFLARGYGVSLTSSMMLSMFITIILLSLGAPGVPGNGLICLGVLLNQIGVPIEAVGLIMAINPIIDMFDTVNNTTGDMAASLLVARSENMVDLEIFNK
ncbi:MAG: dicarboxylate/amino acid:cation symporter [Butyrivibrio sp.]|nr:dicarboxylate/amino acid:cation symporter [Butyrivibrio sp.]